MLLCRRASSLGNTLRFTGIVTVRMNRSSPVFSPSLNRRQTKARYSRALETCVLVDGRMSRDATLATLSSEMILLIVMLAGLVRQRDHYLGRLLFHHVSARFDGSWAVK